MIVEWLTLMPGHILLAASVMFCILLRVRRSANNCRLVRSDVPHLLHCVFL